MSKFAKIIDVEGSQVLVTKDYDTDEEAFLLNVRTDVDGVSMIMGMGFETEERRDEGFDLYGEEDAKKFRSGAVTLFTPEDEKE